MNVETLLNRRYRLIEQLGAGGMAVVFKAQDLSLGRTVSIKVLRESLTDDEEFLTRFQHEARAVANLAHPNIVTVHDFGIDRQRNYMVMEYVDGQDLKSLIRQSAPFDVNRALDYTIQMCAGVGYAHRAGLVHCDLKPQNVLIMRDGRVKVTDFGIARALSTIHPEEHNAVVWGSPQYFSPEQAAGEAPTPATDVYSIGVILFEMLTGQLPFRADTPQELGMMHLREEPPALVSLNPAVPETVDRITRKVLAKEPAARYRTADQLGHILRSYREHGRQITAGRPAAPTAAAASQPQPTQPAPPRPVQSGAMTQASYHADAYEEIGIDWLAFLLGGIALLAVLGLIPLWIFVYFHHNPPTPVPPPPPVGPQSGVDTVLTQLSWSVNGLIGIICTRWRSGTETQRA